MESLSNFNFLKVIDVKKNSDSNNKDKNLLTNEMPFAVGQTDSIENEFDPLLSDGELNASFLVSEKQNKKKSKNSRHL